MNDTIKGHVLTDPQQRCVDYIRGCASRNVPATGCGGHKAAVDALISRGIIEKGPCDYTNRISGRHWTECWVLTS